MKETFNMGLSQLLRGKIKRVLYEEIRMTTTSMAELPKFAEQSINYGFKWMIRASV